MWKVPARWDASAGSQQGVAKVEVWSRGVLVSAVDPADPASGVLTCSVKEEYGTGVRGSLTMTVEPSYAWLSHARRPGLEIRPFSGLAWGNSQYLVPLGRFPILPPSISLPAQAVQIGADDYWSWMGRAKHGAMGATPGLISTVAASRIRAAGLPSPVVTATSTAVIPRAVLWDAGTEADLVSSLLTSIGATGYFDRNGIPRIEDRKTAAGLPLTDGENGTVITVSSTEDWAGVKNRYTVNTSNNDVKLNPQVASITDPNHPAYYANGLGWVDAEYSSPLFTTEAQMLATARMLVTRDSAPAGAWSVSAVPDPARMPGDRITVTTDLGVFTAVIQEITHNLTGEAMTMTLGAA